MLGLLGRVERRAWWWREESLVTDLARWRAGREERRGGMVRWSERRRDYTKAAG